MRLIGLLAAVVLLIGFMATAMVGFVYLPARIRAAGLLIVWLMYLLVFLSQIGQAGGC